METYYGLQAAWYILSLLLINSYVDAFKSVYGVKPRAMHFENVECGVQYSVDLKNMDKTIVDDSIRKFIRGIREGDFTPCLNEFHCSRCEFREKCEYWMSKK